MGNIATEQNSLYGQIASEGRGTKKEREKK
jgi:hypothetical protein